MVWRSWSLCVLAGLVFAGAADAAPPLHREIVGRSVEGRPIRAIRVGAADARRTTLVIGCVHGTERAGEAVTRRLRAVAVPDGSALWLIDEANPDGCHDGTRGNAHGVDLNRNSPWHWRPTGPPGSTYYAGPRASSEPETRALSAFIRRVRPAVTIWYHQAATLVDDPGRDRAIPRRYARTVGLPFKPYPQRLPGIFTGWQNATLPRTTAFVVELPAGALSAAALRRHVRAVRQTV